LLGITPVVDAGVIEFLGTMLANFLAGRLEAALVSKAVPEEFTRPSGTFLLGVIRITEAFFEQMMSGVLAPILAIRLRLAVLLHAGLKGMTSPRGTLYFTRRWIQRHALLEDTFRMPLAAFLTSRRIRRWAIGGDTVLKDFAGLTTARFFVAAGFDAGTKGFARRRVAPIEASRLMIALVRQAVLQESAGPRGTLFLIRLRERHAIVEHLLRVFGAMTFAIRGIGRIAAGPVNHIHRGDVYDHRPS